MIAVSTAGSTPLVVAASFVDSPVIQTALGVGFLFLVLSVVASAAQELIASLLGLRSKSLVEGLTRLLGDKELTSALLSHPLVNGQSRTPRRGPSYLSATYFRQALIDVLATTPNSRPNDASDSLRATRSTIDETIGRLPAGDLKRLLSGFWLEVESDTAAFGASIERWFDSSMERVSGWYQRRTRWIILAIGAVLAISLNASTIDVTNRLWHDPAQRAALLTVVDAQASVAPASNDPSATASLDRIDATLRQLDSSGLSIGWPDHRQRTAADWLITVLGWLVTAVAVSLGAPFWFDVLNRVSNLRTSGRAAPSTTSTQPA